MKTKKPNPQDSTLRNVRAAQRKLVDLEARIATLEETMHAVQTQLASLAMRPEPEPVQPAQ
jgi:hypothetical protein